MIGVTYATGQQIGGKCGKGDGNSLNSNDNSFPTWLLDQFPRLRTVGNGETQADACGKSKANEYGSFGGFSHTSHTSHDTSDHDERVAIMICGGMPEDWAHGFAGLDPDTPDGGLSVRTWQARLDSALLLADCHGWKLSGLGWSFDRMFGVGGDWLALDRRAVGWFLCEALAQVGRMVEATSSQIAFVTVGGVRDLVVND
jgi:hypothetical protein